MRTMEQTTQEVLELAAKHFRVPADSCRPRTISSRSWVSTACKRSRCFRRIENHFGIELPDYEVQGVSDFRTLASRIHSRL